MKIETILLYDYKPAEYNPRVQLKPEDREYKEIERSLEQYGYAEPIIVNRTTMTIVGGHQRANVLMAKGIVEVEAVILEMDVTKEKALNIALNKIKGEWNYDKLEDVMRDIREATTGDATKDSEYETGFNVEEVDALLGIQHIEDQKEDNETYEIHISFGEKEEAEQWLKEKGIQDVNFGNNYTKAFNADEF